MNRASGKRSKAIVRIAVTTMVVAGLLVAALIDVPTKESGAEASPDLPSIALGQVLIYRLEIFLVVFYGALLIVTPVFRGLVGGRLPTEVSARGAKYAEETADSIEETQALVDELREDLKAAQASDARAKLNLEQLAEELSVELRD